MSNPIEVVAGIIVQDGKVLIGERPSSKPYAGYWEFPGGKVESGESEAVALARELSEELGILVHRSQALFVHDYTYPDKTVRLHFLQVLQFEKKISKLEHQDLHWATATDLFSMKLLDGNKDILEKIVTLMHRHPLESTQTSRHPE